jgi:hypothetical protein
MTNPFAAHATAPAAPQAAPTTATPPTYSAPTYQAPTFAAAGNGGTPTFADAASTMPASTGDLFADPSGPGSGEKIADLVGCLLLCKPTEFIPQFDTANGPCDTIWMDAVVLLDPQGAVVGRIADKVPVFQRALVRDLKEVLEGPSPYLIGRLGKGTAKGNKSAPYLFGKATDADKDLARQFLAARQL